ncbi:Vacuolar protein sorting-associated protein 53-like protein [Frankliniella fusca]|uniref:Vacuolar protein sorting-associated protein 53-like protein n=1 Tax=Frankliniella fusca TaxID=407009 RepID=A0AAE1LGW1_9NEOP|nr:Vacuolar protein sorting-associated protein 53-like protein [Frankliniella fusca]
MPPSAQVLRADEFAPKDGVTWIDEGQEREWITKKGNIRGTILKIGKRTDLKKLRVTAAGVVVTGEDDDHPVESFVSTRRNEIAKQNKARDSNIQQMDSFLHDRGPGALPLSQLGATTSRPKPNRRPKQRSEEYLQNLDMRLKTLPCFTCRPGDRELYKNKGVFMNGADLYLIKLQYHNNPAGMLRALLTQLIPEDILNQDGLSYGGTKSTVRIPDNIMAAVTSYVGMNAKGLPFSLNKVLNNFLHKRRGSQFKNLSTAASSATIPSSSHLQTTPVQPTPMQSISLQATPMHAMSVQSTFPSGQPLNHSDWPTTESFSTDLSPSGAALFPSEQSDDTSTSEVLTINRYLIENIG